MRSRIAVLGTLLAAGAVLIGAGSARAASINVGSASGNPGDTVSVSVTLTTGGAEIAGTQNDIAFDASAPIARKANGKPDCAVNADIDKSATSFAFRPASCTAATCTGIRALVLSTDNTTPITDGSALYTCKVAISASATAGDKALTNSGVILSDPSGNRVTPADANNGKVTVAGGATPTEAPATATPTTAEPTATPAPSCADPRPAPAGPAVYVQDENLNAAGDATIQVKLAAASAQVAGTQSDTSFGNGVVIKRKANGKPDCAVNPDIDKSATSFAFRPASCTVDTCTGVRALVLSTDNTNAIPDGSVLFTCNVTVTTGATLGMSGVILSDPSGNRIADATGRDGIICLNSAPPASPTPTPTTGASCADPRPAPAGPAVYVQDENLNAAGDATIQVKLAAASAQVAGTQSDTSFGNGVVIKRKANGKPDCAVNPDIDKAATSFAFRPASCTVDTCTGVRALVLSTDNTNAIPDGSVLFTCNVTVTNGATLGMSGVILSDPSGNRIADATGRDGIICVEGEVPPTATPTTIAPTATAVPPTATSAPVNTATATHGAATATATHAAATATATATKPAATATPISGHVAAGGVASGSMTLPLVSAAGFPSSGTITIAGVPGQFTYSSITGNTLNLTTALPNTLAGGELVTLVGSGPPVLEDEGGCSISGSSSSSGWILLLPLGALLVVRRRGR